MAKAVATKPDRRSIISNALFRTMGRKGYAHSSLKDIALEANMTPSHIRYYFDNKAAILEYLATSICHQTLEGFPDLETADKTSLIANLTSFCLGPGQMSINLLGAIQEITGLAVHDKTLFKIKSQHAKHWHGYLEHFFKKINCRKGLDPETAAWQLHASILGLNTNLVFDGSLKRAQAYDLLHAQILFLAGQK